MGGEQSFLMDGRFVAKMVEASSCARHETVFIIGGGNGLLPSTLADACRLVTVEPDQGIANYLYTLGLYHDTVIHAQPHLVLGDVEFDKLLCLQPEHVDERLLSSMLRVPFSQAVLMMPDDVAGAFRSRNRLGTLLRASYDVRHVVKVPKGAFSPALSFPCAMVSLRPSADTNPVDAALRLLVREAGTMRGLLTRSCREFFGYTLVEAQAAVRMFDQSFLKKRFWDLDEKEFKDVYAWLKLG